MIHDNTWYTGNHVSSWIINNHENQSSWTIMISLFFSTIRQWDWLATGSSHAHPGTSWCTMGTGGTGSAGPEAGASVGSKRNCKNVGMKRLVNDGWWWVIMVDWPSRVSKHHPEWTIIGQTVSRGWFKSRFDALLDEVFKITSWRQGDPVILSQHAGHEDTLVGFSWWC